MSASHAGHGLRVDAAPSLDAAKILSVFLRRAVLFASVATCVLVVALAVIWSAPARYTSTATLLFEEHATDPLDQPRQDTKQAEVGSTAVDTQVEVLRSRGLAARVVDQLHLDRDPEFGGGSREAVVSAVEGALAVHRAGTAYTVDVSFTAKRPDEAALIANAFAQRYLAEAAGTKIGALRENTAWLDTRLTQLRREAEAADTAVAQYKIANNLMSAQGATLAEQETTTLDTQLGQARASEAETVARLRTAQDQLASGSNGGDVGEALNNPVVQQLRAQRAQAGAQLADLQSRYGERHPDLIKARSTVADLDSEISAEISRVISNLKAQAQVARSRTSALAGQVDQSRGRLAGNNRALVRLAELERDDEAARTIYETFLARYKETLSRDGAQEPGARVVSTAQPPAAKSQPNRALGSALALALALVAGVGAVIVAELLERGVATLKDAESEFGLPALGQVPALGTTLSLLPSLRRGPDPVWYVVDKPLSRFAETFRNLRASIVASRSGRPAQVIIMTSSLPDEGKTTTTLCMARTMALAGFKVVTVDCDLRQRSINRMLAHEPSVGLIEVLDGRTSLDDALIVDRATGASILPLSPSPVTPLDVFGGAAMAELVRSLRSRFDLVLLDTAPVLAVADTRTLSPQADAVVLLVRWRKTARRVVEAAMNVLAADGAFIAGVALTQVDARAQGRSGDGDPYASRAYRKYYTG